MRYDDFLIQLDPGAQGELRVRVLGSPAGQGSAELPLDEEILRLGDLLAAGSAPTATRGSRNFAAADDRPDTPRLAIREVGALLCDHLLHGPVRRLFDQSLGGLQSSPDRGLRLRLKLDPRDPKAAELAAMPWELLFRSETEDFLALSRKTPVVRYLDVPRPCRPIAVGGPLRVLAAMATPRDLPPLDLAAERRKLDGISERTEGIQLTFLERASIAAVRETLIDGGFHVFHFMGHGDLDPSTGEGLLFFEGEDGAAEPVSGRAVATKLKDLTALGLVVLNACNTAQAAVRRGASPFGGVATALVLGGVPAVLAMQRPIPDRAAIRFSQALYRRLAAGDPVDGAVTEARQAIHSVSPDSADWAIPVLFTRVPDGNVFTLDPAAVGRAVPLCSAPAPEPAEQATFAKPQAPPSSAVEGGVRARKRLVVGLAAVTAAVVVAVAVQLGPWTKVEPDKPSGTKTGNSSLPQSAGTSAGSAARDTQPPTSRVAETPRQAKPEAKPGETTVIRPEPPATAAAPQAVPVSTSGEHLSCRCSSFTRREGKGMQALLTCTNAGPTHVELTLEAFLSDDGSNAYSVVGSSLPAGTRGPLLAVDPGAAATFSLDFPVPKGGASDFYLELAGGGFNIPLEGSALSL